MKRALLVAVLTSLAPALGMDSAIRADTSTAEVQRPEYEGRPLVEALDDLRSRGLNLIYSSDLVKGSMLVEHEPTSTSLHKTLVQILGPHGLEPRIGPNGSVLVVKRGQEPFVVTIDEPRPFQSIFGDVEFSARVHTDEVIDRVEFLVDGSRVALLRQEPFRVRANVGLENTDHRFEVRAHGRWGGFGAASVDTRMVEITDQVEVALKQLFVTVHRDGNRALDLGRENFTVIDGGVRQDLVTFERGDVPITAVLLVDASESMQGGALEAALDGARAFLDRLSALDEAMVMLFSDRAIATAGFSNDKAELVDQLDGVVARGGTAINDHLYAALRLLDERRGRRVVVLISDGADVLSALRMRDVLWKIQRSDALLYWIRLDGQGQQEFSSAWRDFEGNRAEWEGLEAAVAESGGRIEILSGIDRIDTAFAGIMNELRDQYVLGYYPTDRRRNGDWRNVRVRVADAKAKVRFRAGYIDN